MLASCRLADERPLTQLQTSLKEQRLRSKIVLDAAAAGVRVSRSSVIAHEDGYRLTGSGEGIEILSRTDAGAYDAQQTLRRLIRCHETNPPCCRVDDQPDFRRRTIYHDCTRGKAPTVETLKALVERLVGWRINELQLNIENGFVWQSHPGVSRGFSPYSPADILENQAHCAHHHMRLAGSPPSLGHQELVLRLKP